MARAKATPECPFVGRWRIVSMTEFDEDCINEEVQGFIEFDSNEGGKFHFGCWRGAMDCRRTTRDGEPVVEWSWEGFEEMDPEAGSGWAVRKGDDLHGVIGFNDGEESGFVATRMRDPKAGKRKKTASPVPEQPRKLSEILKEMSETLLRRPKGVPSSEAAHVALFFANVAWNECVGLDNAREGYRNVWETIEAENPELWNEFRSSDINAMIDELVRYKQAHYPDDRRRILTCGMPEGKVRVEWLAPAAPGVDSRWEMQLYGLVRVGEKEKAIRFLQETRRMARKEAVNRVAQIAAELGMK